MSKLFYDHLIVLEDLEKEIKRVSQNQEEKEELWKIVDETIHHKALGCIFENLPKEHHQEFLEKFHTKPYDETLMDYLKGKIGENFEELLRQELGNFAYELLLLSHGHPEHVKTT